MIRRLVWQWLSYPGPKWSARAVGRRLGVSHTYIQKLVREFAEDPNKAEPLFGLGAPRAALPKNPSE